jgi:hypothetical protein
MTTVPIQGTLYGRKEGPRRVVGACLEYDVVGLPQADFALADDDFEPDPTIIPAEPGWYAVTADEGRRGAVIAWLITPGNVPQTRALVVWPNEVAAVHTDDAYLYHPEHQPEPEEATDASP